MKRKRKNGGNPNVFRNVFLSFDGFIDSNKLNQKYLKSCCPKPAINGSGVVLLFLSVSKKILKIDRVEEEQTKIFDFLEKQQFC